MKKKIVLACTTSSVAAYLFLIIVLGYHSAIPVPSLLWSVHQEPTLEDNVLPKKAIVAESKAIGAQNAQAFYDYHNKQMKELIKESTILEWCAKCKPHNFGGFLTFFPYDNLKKKSSEDVNKIMTNTSRHFVYADDLCSTSRQLQEIKDSKAHILLLHLNENWGGLSSVVPGRTTDWVDLEEKFKGCWEDIYAYLDLPTTLAVFTSQFQHIAHPKVHSIPLGIMRHLRGSIVETAHQPGSRTRAKLLMINGKNRTNRQKIHDRVIKNFNGRLQNTYRSSGSDTYESYVEEMRRSKFILSPSGLGWDCYRHWEAIYLGTIPVLEHYNRLDGWYRTLDDLPVAWVDFYDNLTQSVLDREYSRITRNPERYKYEKLTMQWWIDFVNSFLPGPSKQ
jgi:hypothetical protein